MASQAKRRSLFDPQILQSGFVPSSVSLRFIRSRTTLLQRYQKNDLLRVHVAGALIALFLYLLASWIQYIKS